MDTCHIVCYTAGECFFFLGVFMPEISALTEKDSAVVKLFQKPSSPSNPLLLDEAKSRMREDKAMLIYAAEIELFFPEELEMEPLKAFFAVASIDCRVQNAVRILCRRLGDLCENSYVRPVGLPQRVP